MLNESQIRGKLEFVSRYVKSGKNPATLSKVDANANIAHKNMATMMNELFKQELVQLNRALMHDKITERHGVETANQYLRDIENKLVYSHDESLPFFPYCCAVSLYPFLVDGLRKLGGESGPPTHVASFCGGFINLVFALSSQFSGAIGTPEFLMYFDHFARKDWGDDYLKTHRAEVKAYMKQVVYSVNQPAAARGNQSIFVNFAFFDRYYFEGMFGNFFFPNGERPSWESLSELQKFFLRWINAERTRAELTFPVLTLSLHCEETADGGWSPRDSEWVEFAANELSEGNSFFVYMSDSVDSLSSCCRLRNEIDRNDFSASIGGAGVDTGSIKVMTINVNRLVQRFIDGHASVGEAMAAVVRRVHKYLDAHRALMAEYVADGVLDAYTAGFASLEKQYSTVGLNGLVEAAEYYGMAVSENEEYYDFRRAILETVRRENKEAKARYGFKINTEFVPAENLGVKNAKWDLEDGLLVSRDCYNSYFYVVEDDYVDLLEKIRMHGGDIMDSLDGGSAMHANLAEHATADAYVALLKAQASAKCPYMTVNVKNTICNACGHIGKSTRRNCEACGSDNVDWGTRIIGYFKRVSAFSEGRQIEEARRAYHEKLKVHPVEAR